MRLSLKRYWSQLRTNPSLNPFNPNFSIEEVNNKIIEIKDIYSRPNLSRDEKDECLKLFETFISAIKISDIYPSAYKYFEEDIINGNSSIKELYFFLMAVLCRHYLLIENTRKTSLLEDSVLSISNIESINIKSLDKGIGEINATSALEGEIDSTSILLNYLYYFDDGKINTFDSSKKDVYPIEKIKSLSMHANILWAIKSSFESAIWNYGYLRYNNDTNTASIKYSSVEKLKLEYTGLIRFKEILFSHYHILNSAFSPKENICSNKKNKRIENVCVKLGYIEYTLIDGFDKKENGIHLNYTTQIDCFYSFVNKSFFTNENYSNLNIETSISMLSVITNLLNHIEIGHIIPDDSIFSKKDFYKFPVKIKYSLLKALLSDKTSFAEEQIDSFISLISTDKSNRLNLWETPLIKDNDEFLIAFLPLTQPMLCRFVDVWLSKGEISLDTRGLIFENYVKSELKIILEEKKANHNFIDIKEFENKNKEKEEIDLVLELEDILILGEIKCIVYPMSNRDHYNSFETLKKGCKQIIRKSNFLLRNTKHFADIIKNLDQKKIVKVVITNFPIFSGQIYNEIPIVDFHLLKNYFEAGEFTQIEEIINQGKPVSIAQQQTKYYSNNIEMAKNLNGFLNKPLPIYSVYKNIDTSILKITPEGMGFDMYTEYAHLK